MKDNLKNEYLINKENNDKTMNKEKISNTNYYEAIIIIIINQIIKNAINEIRRKELFEKMKNHCFNFLMNNINIYLKSQNFVYDNDLEGNKGKIFFDFKQEKFDKELDAISEPLPPEKDRNNSNMIKIINDERLSVNDNIFKLNKSQKNFLNELIKIENLLEPKNEKIELLENQSINTENKTININLIGENSTNSINENLIIKIILLNEAIIIITF